MFSLRIRDIVEPWLKMLRPVSGGIGFGNVKAFVGRDWIRDLEESHPQAARNLNLEI